MFSGSSSSVNCTTGGVALGLSSYPTCPKPNGAHTLDRYEANESFFYELMSIFRRGGPGRAFCAYALKARPRRREAFMQECADSSIPCPLPRS